jgi:hypothetical protein
MLPCQNRPSSLAPGATTTTAATTSTRPSASPRGISAQLPQNVPTSYNNAPLTAAAGTCSSMTPSVSSHTAGEVPVIGINLAVQAAASLEPPVASNNSSCNSSRGSVAQRISTNTVPQHLRNTTSRYYLTLQLTSACMQVCKCELACSAALY